MQTLFSREKESDLIDAAREGDQNAFRQIVEQFQDVVAATVKGMLGNTVEAEDVGQETFIRFYKSLNSFRKESSLKTYLIRIAINLSLNELSARKRKYTHFVEDEEDVLKSKKGVDNERSKDNNELIEKALQMLNPRDRSLIVLRMIQGYTTKETAKMLELPLGTVLSGLSRAQGKLKKIIMDLE